YRRSGPVRMDPPSRGSTVFSPSLDTDRGGGRLKLMNSYDRSLMVDDRGGMARRQRVIPTLMISPSAHPGQDGPALEAVLQHPGIRLAFEALDTGTGAHLRRVG